MDTGTAELVPDPDRPRAWTLVLDGAPQSHVDLDDPRWLAFEYVRRLAHVVDTLADPGAPLDVVHLGGGAMTLARYVAATRPGSRQRVVEVDAALVELVRRELPLGRTVRVRVRTGDARAGLATLPAGAADLVVTDVFAGARVPAHLGTVELVRDAARVLRGGGAYALNLADGPPLGFARSCVATVAAVFPHAALMVDPSVLRGRRFGNLVLVASDRPLALPALTRCCAGDPVPARVLHGEELRRFAGDAPVRTDAAPQASPRPPEGVFGRAGRTGA